MPRHRPLLAVASAALLAIALSGCSVKDVFSGSRESQFASYDAAVEHWVSDAMPAWIPTDATDIRSLETKDGRLSVIRVTTSSPPVGECVEREREGVPVLTATWTAAAERPAVVTVCDDYEIMPMDDGWLGWFEAAEPPSRRAASRRPRKRGRRQSRRSYVTEHGYSRVLTRICDR